MEIYKNVVGKGKIPPTYFLDEMSTKEVTALYESQYEEFKNGWEQTRYISFIMAAQGGKIKKPTDLLKFAWDNETKKEEVLSKEERIIREREMIEWYKTNH